VERKSTLYNCPDGMGPLHHPDEVFSPPQNKLHELLDKGHLKSPTGWISLAGLREANPTWPTDSSEPCKIREQLEGPKDIMGDLPARGQTVTTGCKQCGKVVHYHYVRITYE